MKLKTIHWVGIAVIGIMILIGCMAGCPKYNVWIKEMSGKAKLAEAEQDRQILIEEARARLEAEKLNAQAEIERAKGMKEAINIEAGGLSTEYNQYLMIRTLEELGKQGDLPMIIYLPSEGLLPVMDVKTK